jgi:hypothetical protein
MRMEMSRLRWTEKRNENKKTQRKEEKKSVTYHEPGHRVIDNRAGQDRKGEFFFEQSQRENRIQRVP